MKKRDIGKEATYKVKLRCRNCNESWIHNVEKGIYVRYIKDNNFMVKRGESNKKRKLFTCPKCGAHTKIARLPLY